MKINGGICSRNELSEFIVSHFNYDPLIIDAWIELMLQCEIIQHLDPVHNIPTDHVRLTKLGTFILERLITNLEYINLAIQSIPLPVWMIEKGLFPICEINDANYVLYKIKSSVNFTRLVGDLEEEERMIFNRNAGGKGYNFDNYKGNNDTNDNKEKGFSIAAEIKNHVYESIKRIITAAHNSRNMNLVKGVSREFGIAL
jgi:hypothetical protein